MQRIMITKQDCDACGGSGTRTYGRSSDPYGASERGPCEECVEGYVVTEHSVEDCRDLEAVAKQASHAELLEFALELLVEAEERRLRNDALSETCSDLAEERNRLEDMVGRIERASGLSVAKDSVA